MTIDESTFTSPPRTDRGGPLWVWNDTMDGDHLSDQIEAMADSGWGQFFVHPRLGLTVDYLSAEWSDKVRDSVEVAIDNDIEPWLYDEDRWPSGYGGGVVPERGPDYRLKGLTLQRETGPYDDLVTEFVHEGERYCLSVTTVPSDAEWTFNGTPYVDLMNPDVVTAFLDSTYERYAETVGEYFGDGIPGIFTDEPQLYCDFENPDPDTELLAAVPWTVDLPEAFQDMHGYDVREHLESLFFDVTVDGRPPAAVRHDFWKFVTDRFVEVFSERIGDWCRGHDLDLTGHYLNEDSIGGQVPAVGAVMPHYEHQGQPGIDHLGRNVDTPLTLKQCSSVANQFGRRALSELYGCSGQQFSFETRKWIGDWHMALGVTTLNHHLSLYSMRGERKRDFPPNIFYQQPWWDHNDLIADYFARIAYALRQGTPANDTLLIHPVHTGWIEYDGLPAFGEDDGPLQNLDERLSGLLDRLLADHVGFDLGDEMIMEDRASVVEDTLEVGQMRYTSVVVPYCRTLQESTVALLEDFQSAGGTIHVVGDAPTLIDGRSAPDRLDALFSGARDTREAGLGSEVERPVRIVDADGRECAPAVRTNVRRTDGGLIVFLANTDRDDWQHGTLEIDASGALQRWDPATGTQTAVDATSEDGTTRTPLSVPPTGSRLLVLDTTAEEPESGASLEYDPPEGSERPLDGEWAFERHDPNALVLDRCELTLDGADLGETNVAEHWSDIDALDDPAEHVPFAATYAFSVPSAVDREDMAVVVESGPEQTIRLNGTTLGPPADTWRDVHWYRYDVGELVETGHNELEVTGVRSETVSVEPVFLLGSFALGDDLALQPEPGVIHAADITEEGYPFFTGAMTLETTVDLAGPRAATLGLDDLRAALAVVSVDGEEVASLWREPWEVPLSLPAGTSRLEIRLLTSLRNLTGPHHADEAEPEYVGPHTFRPPNDGWLGTSEWYEGYRTVPVGVTDPTLYLD